MIEKFAADLALRRLSNGHISATVGRARAWLAWCSAHQIAPEAARREDFLAYLRERQSLHLKSETLKKDFGAIAALYDFLGCSGQVAELTEIRKRYLRCYKSDAEERQDISIADASRLVALTLKTRDRAILLALLKTGIRRGELLSLDTSSVDMSEMTIRLKPTGKRSNRTVFFDRECQDALARWLKVRGFEDGPLFLNSARDRLGDTGQKKAMRNAGLRAGLHDPTGPLEARFGAHVCRHWFTTQLLRAGMRREYVQWLRGDAIREAVDIYFDIDPADVRRAYLAHIPQLGI